MSSNQLLQTYAREHFMQRDPKDYLMVDKFVKSDDFNRLAGVLVQNMEKAMAKFRTEHPSQKPQDVAASESRTKSEQMEFQTLVPGSDTKTNEQTTQKTAEQATQAATRQEGGPSTTPKPKQDALLRLALNAYGQNAPPAPVDRPAPAFAPAPRPAVAPAPPEKPESMPTPKVPDRADITFRLQNARDGEAYSQNLMAVPEDARPVVFIEIRIPDGLNMTDNKNNGLITGTPQAAGDHEIIVIYHFADQPPSHKRRAVVKLTVTADPKKMWKNLPSDRNAVFWREDEACEVVQGPEFKIIAASKRGRSHEHVGSFRDDDYKIEHLGDSGWYVAVVSDGAGSATYSRRGAQIICTEAVDHLRRTLNGPEGKTVDQATDNYYKGRSSKDIDAPRLANLRQLLHNSLYGTVGYAAYHAVKAIRADCDSHTELKATYKDYSSTALIAACKRYSFGTLCATYWVGDGAVAIYSKSTGVTLLGDVDSGEYSGQTRFLDITEVDQEALLKRTQFEIVDDLTAFILMSDGVSDPKFETEARLARTAEWDALWLELESAVGLTTEGEGKEQKLLAWLDFWSQGNHDDRTIAIIL